MHLKTSQSPVYFHEFSYRGQYSIADLDPLTRGRDHGVIHSDDLLYLFETLAFFPAGLNEKDKAASEQYVSYIVQFVVDQSTPENAQCKLVEHPMCAFVKFTKNPQTGALERRKSHNYDTEMPEFWDQTREIPL